jgi:hypothetical protein
VQYNALLAALQQFFSIFELPLFFFINQLLANFILALTGAGCRNLRK